MNIQFLEDKQTTHVLCLSLAWIRKQGWMRRHGMPDFLTIDPIMIGTVPRYQASDVEAWLATLEPTNDNEPGLVVNGGGT